MSPDEYLPYVTAFLRHHPSGTVFVATDSPAFLASIRERWPASNLKYRTDVLRDERNVAFARGRGGGQGGGSGRGYQKGEDVLLDMLLLSRCDWLLHAASGVAEFAIYFNPQLHERSVHLQYEHAGSYRSTQTHGRKIKDGDCSDDPKARGWRSGGGRD